jgi:5-methyltetrahydrofolate--homocysteine methyltransferase
MKLVGQLFGSGQLQLPFVLQSAEVVKRTVKLLEPFMEKKEIDPGKKMILATVAGDVHDIGKNLVNIMLSNNGYYVKDLGIKVDIDTMIHAAEEEGASVIGMSGLLVRSTQVMKENLQELNRRGLTPSIILGGAALTREYVEKDLGSIYDGKVFYAEDAIDGLKIMEKLTGEKSKKTEVSPQDSSNIEPAKASRKVETVDPSVLGAANRHQFVKSEEIIKPPFYANHYLEIDSTSLFQMMSHKVLFEARWGYKKNDLSDEEYKELLENEARPMLHKFIEMDRAEEILQTKGVYGYYRCRAKGNTVRILDDAGICIGEFEFPRQKNPPHLCISDFFSDSEDDTIALWATTVGSHFAEVEKRIYAEDRFKDYHLLHGMGAELADCGAVYIHRHIHKELFPQITLGQNEPKGVRYSFGYPACPDLEAQKELFRILKAEEIGIKLTESNQMVPELSVSGFIVFNKHGRYFVP